MTEITDDFMRGMLSTTRIFTIVFLGRGPRYGTPDSQPVIWEHGRRNFELRDVGKLALVGPLTDGGAFVGLGVFTVDADETRALMDQDPAIRAGILSYEIHAWRSFPGDALPV